MFSSSVNAHKIAIALGKNKFKSHIDLVLVFDIGNQRIAKYIETNFSRLKNIHFRNDIPTKEDLTHILGRYENKES